MAIAPPKDVPTREAIQIVRVLCILGIVYVHAWTGLTAEQIAALDQTPQGLLRWILIELVGRSAVPLLGAISGWLSGPSAAKRGYGAFVKVKARTVLAPMILWNLIALALVSGSALAFALPAPVPASVKEALDWIGCITQPNPINVQISFLRDLFLCMCAAPLLTRLPDRWLWLLWAITAAWSISNLQLYLLLRPPILLFFLSGMLARRHAVAERIARWPVLGCVMPYLLLIPGKVVLGSQDDDWLKAHAIFGNAIDLPMRFAAALAIWRIALALVPTRTGRRIIGLERYAFLLFCSHLVLIWLLGPPIGLVTGRMGAPGYIPFLLLQPLLALGATILLGRALEGVSHPLAKILSGGRLDGVRPQTLPRRAPSAKGTAKPDPGA
ncbi:acyltransferase family protein [Sphingomonas abietis]|uniref:Acyltransferase n=1 Tax=Sphingomonas abietis TaxID=3012344 RepID=A0ABY7NKY4_9SPHN|nr:acyltransferase [Sphingomonas abietis]WBO22212.1 acyltransferase [Sphingomonas abietis]